MIKNIIKKIVQSSGYDIRKKNSFKIHPEFPSDFSENDIKIIKKIKPFTLTSNERIYSLIQATKYVADNNLPGDIVECGVWKGGSMMLAAKTLMESDNTDYELYLFDTFEGTTKPTEVDKDYLGNSMLKTWENEFEGKEKLPPSADYVPLEQVQKNLFSIGYPKEKIHFIKGKVEDTIPKNSPEKIAILRLDTDWYESTKHELENLFPILSSGGILIIDDYGHFEGSKKAVDEYFAKNKIKYFLNRIDYTGRLIIKI